LASIYGYAFGRRNSQSETNFQRVFTFEYIKDAVGSVSPQCFENLLSELVYMIIFDALAGNSDRHFYNGVVIDPKKRSQNFLPFYDSARRLMFNSEMEILKR